MSSQKGLLSCYAQVMSALGILLRIILAPGNCDIVT